MTWRASTDERLVALAHSLDDARANLDAGSLFEPRPGLSRAARRRRRDTSAGDGFDDENANARANDDDARIACSRASTGSARDARRESVRESVLEFPWNRPFRM